MRFFVVLLAVFMVGCSAGPIKNKEGLIYPFGDTTERTAELVFMREGPKFGNAGALFICIDGEDVFGINVQEYTKIKVTPGVHKISLSTYGTPLLVVRVYYDQYIEFKENETVYVVGKKDFPEPTFRVEESEEIAHRLMQDFKYRPFSEDTNDRTRKRTVAGFPNRALP